MALLLAAAGALWWSDRAPVPVLVGTAVAAVAYYVAGGPPGPEPVPFVVASGFALKDLDPSELTDGLRAIARGEALLAPALTRRLIEAFAARPTRHVPPLDPSVLTDREREVLDLVVRGQSNEDIAARLHISPATAKTHVSRILSKVGARDRAMLIIMAYESGLVTPGRP